MCRELVPNQSLQQTKPPVTVRACARPAPADFAAEAGVIRLSWQNLGRKAKTSTSAAKNRKIVQQMMTNVVAGKLDTFLDAPMHLRRP